MLFSFLKYITPTWYFNLPSLNQQIPYFLDWDGLSDQEKSLIDWDEGYSNREVSKIDAAYQAWQKGYISTNDKAKLVYTSIQPSINDNYRLIRRFFHPFWAVYILVLRLISLKNPIKEIKGFWKNRKVKRINLYSKVFPHEKNYLLFNSKLVHNAPKVSVIIPTLNRYTYLKDALVDLEQQTFKNFDVIVVDQSEPYLPDFYIGYNLDLKVVRQEEKALWLARNSAVKFSDAEYLLLYDDDSRVEHDWIAQHLKCLDYFQADISSGVSISKVGAKVPENYSFFRWSDQLDTGNVLVKRSVFKKIGLFDRQFERQRMGDGEFGLRAYLAGYKNISNPYSQRLHLKVGEGGLRQMGSWDAFRPKGWFAPRPIPSVLYFYRKYFGNKIAILSIIKNILPSIVPYSLKGKKGIIAVTYLLGVFFLPILFWQVRLSWKLASQKLYEGERIDKL